jgi:hypothetical protein
MQPFAQSEPIAGGAGVNVASGVGVSGAGVEVASPTGTVEVGSRVLVSVIVGDAVQVGSTTVAVGASTVKVGSPTPTVAAAVAVACGRDM